MGILSTRSSSRKFPGQAKSDTSVANHEINLSPDGGTQDQDEADMAKLGMRQQTKVSRWMYPSKIDANPSLTVRLEKIWTSYNTGLHNHHDVHMGIGSSVSIRMSYYIATR